MIRKITTPALGVCLMGIVCASAAFADEPVSSTAAPVPAPAAEVASDSAPTAEAAPADGGSDAACGHSDLPAGHANLAAQATDPTAALIAFKLQNYFIFQSMDKELSEVPPVMIDADGYANQFDVQVVAPIPKLGWFPRSILRPTIPLVTTPDMEANLPGGISVKQKSKTGLGDIAYVWLPVHDFSWGTVGFGPAGAFPTATDKLLGARKWTLGPAAVILIKAIPKVQIGGLLFNTWSVGGRGDNDVNSMAFQPVLTWHFAPSWYTGLGDTAYTFDWENDNQIYAPLSYRLGKIVSIGKQHIDVNGQFIYNVGDRIPGKDRWGFKFTLNFLFPAG